MRIRQTSKHILYRMAGLTDTEAQVLEKRLARTL
jgi:hypothetical protein